MRGTEAAGLESTGCEVGGRRQLEMTPGCGIGEWGRGTITWPRAESRAARCFCGMLKKKVAETGQSMFRPGRVAQGGNQAHRGQLAFLEPHC